MSIQVDQSLQTAINEFKNVLTEDQRKELQAIKAVPDTDAVITFTAKLDQINPDRRGNSIATRLYSVLQSVQEFSAIIDTFVSSHPDIAALVWGSVKLTMLIVVNFTSYFRKLSDLFMGFHKFCPRFAEYQLLYPHSSGLQRALCSFHASIVRCCKKAVEAIQRPWPTQVYNALWQSFDQEFDSYKVDVKRNSKEVKEEIALAKAKADRQDQELQSKERKAASGHRRELQFFLSRTGREIEGSREWRIESDEHRARKRRKQLLDSLSSYDYLKSFKQARKKRHNNTALWLSQTQEFTEWIENMKYPVFWCSGKLGSGKTILTTGVIDYLFLSREKSAVGASSIAFFFSRYDESMSLKAETVLRSIIRQSLDPKRLTKEIESDLEMIQENPLSGLEELERLLEKQVAASETFYIIIDALDECEKRERDAIFKILSTVIAAGSRMKLFLSSRDSILEEIVRHFPFFQHVSMKSPKAQSDIATYVADIISEKRNNGELVVGNGSLVREIQDALIQGAQGMFLWVAFQIDEICSQYCDEDIRKVLADLPKDLTETFKRAVDRIISHRHEKIAQQVFRWVAVAKRPLSLEELREAISIEPGQSYSKPDRLVNDISRIRAWCENLVDLDEELEIVQFPHHTVQRFFLSDTSDPRYNQFHINLENVDHYVGEVCVTFLNFNDFKTALIRRPRPLPAITPIAIATEALGLPEKPSITTSFLWSISKFRQNKTGSVNITEALASYNKDGTERYMENLYPGHPFLQYASESWLAHTRRFEEGKSKTWDLWIHMIKNEHDLVQTPWTNTQLAERDPLILKWSCDERHWAMLYYITSNSRIPPGYHEYLAQITECSAMEGDLGLLNILYERCFIDTGAALQAAAHGCQLEMVERLRAALADLDAAKHNRHIRQTALRVAAEGGHLEVVERFLAANAVVNAVDPIGRRTALQAAAGGGHLAVVERLLAAKADVNAAAAPLGGRTALQGAAQGGHLEVVERLLAAKADVNAAAATRYDGRTALQAAAQGGHLEVVERLLAANAVVDAAALRAAARSGNLQVVSRLESTGTR